MDALTKPHFPSLEAASPFELRGNWGWRVSDADIRRGLATGDIGFLHSFTTGSTVDGPGLRVVAWTMGCQFRCLYCHNPDTWNMSHGIPVTLIRAIEELRKYRRGLKVMSGGFTLSGGEPLMQDRFAIRLFRAARDMGIHTALDTNGSLGSRLHEVDLQAIDLVLLDIKCWNPELHQRLTGSDITPVLGFARRLARNRRPVWLRFVLVPTLTDNPDDIAKLAEFAAGLGVVERVDILPFHQLGQFKWNELKLSYTLTQVQPPTPDNVAAARATFHAYGLKAF